MPISVEVPVINNSVNIIPTKAEFIDTHFKEDEEDAPKENTKVEVSEMKPECTSSLRESARSRLRRLGALYAGG
jgi:hypothetical protein